MSADAIAISTRGLSKCYGRVRAVDDVTLSVPAGRVLALMGRNGAGKTTLIKALLGLVPASAGQASVLGLNPVTAHVAIRQRVGYVPEAHRLYGWMAVAEICRFTSAFYPRWDATACTSLLDRFGLDPEKKVKALSRGMTAKLGLTLALAHQPELLVLDEPMGGLDAVVRHEFIESIIGVAADAGRTVLISSHLLAEIDRVVDMAALLDRGRLRFAEDVEALKGRVREIRVTFADPPAATDLDLPGVVSVARDGREWTLVVDRFSEALLTDLRQHLPGSSCEVRNLGLEQIFVALAGKEE